MPGGSNAYVLHHTDADMPGLGNAYMPSRFGVCVAASFDNRVSASFGESVTSSFDNRVSAAFGKGVSAAFNGKMPGGRSSNAARFGGGDAARTDGFHMPGRSGDGLSGRKGHDAVITVCHPNISSGKDKIVQGFGKPLQGLPVPDLQLILVKVEIVIIIITRKPFFNQAVEDDKKVT